jgi:hypothetical protein
MSVQRKLHDCDGHCGGPSADAEREAHRTHRRPQFNAATPRSGLAVSAREAHLQTAESLLMESYRLQGREVSTYLEIEQPVEDGGGGGGGVIDVVVVHGVPREPGGLPEDPERPPPRPAVPPGPGGQSGPEPKGPISVPRDAHQCQIYASDRAAGVKLSKDCCNASFPPGTTLKFASDCYDASTPGGQRRYQCITWCWEDKSISRGPAPEPAGNDRDVRKPRPGRRDDP